MIESSSTGNSDGSFARGLSDVRRYYLGGRRGIIALVAVALVAGLAFNWGWQVAAGIAPVLLTALPCLAMCALGLCMNTSAPPTSQVVRADQSGKSKTQEERRLTDA